MRKLQSCRGETLTETLAAILIVVLSSIMLVTMSLGAVRINRTAAALDETLRQQQEEAERQLTGESAVVAAGPYSYEVQETGGDGELASYTLVKEAAP
jgi:type II secretory pathway pseudopilin PulG